jgi:hypothetical protein
MRAGAGLGGSDGQDVEQRSARDAGHLVKNPLHQTAMRLRPPDRGPYTGDGIARD